MTLPITADTPKGLVSGRRAHPVRQREPDLDLELPHLLRLAVFDREL